MRFFSRVLKSARFIDIPFSEIRIYRYARQNNVEKSTSPSR